MCAGVFIYAVFITAKVFINGLETEYSILIKNDKKSLTLNE